MSVFRTYFSKNNTLIEDNETNNSQNPVTEISYGTLTSEVSRFIFDINLEPLIQRIEQGIINSNRIQKHVLKMTNTIRFDETYLNKKTYDGITQRASSFDLELFNLTEEWDEGSGYEFVFDEEEYINISRGASNWYDRKTDIEWENEGAYISGTSIMLGNQHFEKGNEDIEIDITDYINIRLGLVTGTTTGQTSGFTGLTTSTGIGIKFTDQYEALETLYRQAVAFFARKTHTFYEPHIETVYDDTIRDDRNHFFLDKDNELYLYANVGNKPKSVNVTGVTILDYMGKEVEHITGDSIENVSLGVYKVTVNIDSSSYPDAVLFTDRWHVIQNSKFKTIDQEFYLISQNNYFNFNLGTKINFENYFFSYVGIQQGEKIRNNEIRKIYIELKELYPNQNNFLPLEVEYRLYNSQTNNHQIDVIPWTKVNRTFQGFDILLDFSWLIPQDYKLEFRLINGNVFQVKDPLKFTVISENISRP